MVIENVLKWFVLFISSQKTIVKKYFYKTIINIRGPCPAAKRGLKIPDLVD